MLGNAEDGAEELVSRWVARDRAARLLQDGYHVWEPRVFREDMRARYGAYAGRAWAGTLDSMPVEEEPAAQEEQDPQATTAPMPPMPEEGGKGKAAPEELPGRKDNAEARAAAAAVLCGPKDDVLSFGKHKGRTYQDALRTDKDYVRWVLSHCNENSSQDLCHFKDWLLAKAESEKEGSAVG